MSSLAAEPGLGLRLLPIMTLILCHLLDHQKLADCSETLRGPLHYLHAGILAVSLPGLF